MKIKEESSIISDKINQNEIKQESNSNSIKKGESSHSINQVEKKYKAEILNIRDDSELQVSLTFKIIIIGNSGVGKTSITNNAVKSVFFESYKATVGVEIFSLFVKVNNIIIKLQIWDTCGQEIYRSLISNFYRNSSMAIIVYSIDKKDSFKDIELWIKELRIHSSPDIKIILIGNKADLDYKREVTYEEGAEYLEDERIMSFYETSAKTGDNVKKLFEEIAIELYKDYRSYKPEESLKSTSTILSSRSDYNHKKSCC